jgi:hypothetical protein
MFNSQILGLKPNIIFANRNELPKQNLAADEHSLVQARSQKNVQQEVTTKLSKNNSQPALAIANPNWEERNSMDFSTGVNALR